MTNPFTLYLFLSFSSKGLCISDTGANTTNIIMPTIAKANKSSGCFPIQCTNNKAVNKIIFDRTQHLTGVLA